MSRERPTQEEEEDGEDEEEEEEDDEVEHVTTGRSCATIETLWTSTFARRTSESLRVESRRFSSG
ncbi:MAG TPA: hypothetical protein V6C97_08175 [Oculatellaceae cyanobacterium]